MVKLKSISVKILVSYLLVVLFTFGVTALTFYPMVVGVLEKRAEIGLEKQAWEIAHMVARDKAGLLARSEQKLPMSILLLGQAVESDYILIDINETISYSTRPDLFPVGRSIYEVSTNIRTAVNVDEKGSYIHKSDAFLAAEVPIGVASKLNGSVLTFVSTHTLQAMYNDVLSQFLISLIIALLGALLIALMLVRNIVKPLRILERYAEAVGNRRFDVRLDVKTDDELSKLAASFNQMADRLRSYDESRRNFFQNASHEMKTPLMSINGYAEGIRDGVFTGSDLDKAVDIIHKESLRLKNLVDNMIDITILDQQSKDHYYLPNDLHSIIEEAIISVGGYALERRVHIGALIDTDIWVVGDWDQLLSVFVNLLSNGIRHSNSMVSIEARRPLKGTEVVITIGDDGPGFSEQDLVHAFDFFYTRAKEGSGLGLSIVQKILEDHNGTIRLANSPDGGAQIKVGLPFYDPAL